MLLPVGGGPDSQRGIICWRSTIGTWILKSLQSPVSWERWDFKRLCLEYVCGWTRVWEGLNYGWFDFGGRDETSCASARDHLSLTHSSDRSTCWSWSMGLPCGLVVLTAGAWAWSWLWNWDSGKKKKVYLVRKRGSGSSDDLARMTKEKNKND